MSAISTAYSALSDINLWSKVASKDQVFLADIPALIKIRYPYIVSAWPIKKEDLISRLNNYEDPARLQKEIDTFSQAVDYANAHPDSLLSVNPNQMLLNYYSVFNFINISDLPLTPQENTIVQNEINRVSQFTNKDFIDLRNKLIAGRDAVADSINGSDPTYNAIYSRSSLPGLLTTSANYILYSGVFQNGILACTDIIANNKNLLGSTAIIDPFAFARSNANNPNIDIRSYNSGSLTRLNYGESLETLALRTMKDESRWMDIAIANGLRPPYIDEIGQAVTLLSNANGNYVNLPATDTNGNQLIDSIYVNQIVLLSSNTQRQYDQRLVVSIKQLPVSGNLVIELDGPSNLSQYTLLDNASLTYFQRNTINSNFYILIPSITAVANNPNANSTPWFLSSSGQDERNAGVDLYINDINDLVINGNNDLQLSYGVANATQAVRLLLSTPAGALRQHPGYGLSVPIGAKNIDTSAVKRFLAQNISNQILRDKRFQRLDHITVQYLADTGGPSGYLVNLGVILAGGRNNVIPISFSVNLS